MANLIHPLVSGSIIPSIGGHFTYRIIGPCCRLFDREQLPWPCCRLQWRGKEPSWRRIGRRLTPDIATQKAPSYGVEVLEPGCSGAIIVVTLYGDRLSPQLRDWWYSRRRHPSEHPDRSPSPSPYSRLEFEEIEQKPQAVQGVLPLW